MAGLTKKEKAAEVAGVEQTVAIRIPRYLRDRLMKEAKSEGRGWGFRGKCVARLLLEKLDPKMAEKYPDLPSQRR